MRIIVVGAGEVGASIAVNLADAHDLTVIDADPGIVEDLTYATDVLAVEGDGTSRRTLEAAGAADADMVIASTDDDETNLVVCGTAKTLGDAFTIARVRNAEFLDTWEHADGAFGVDFMVSTDLLAAEDIVRIIGLPAAVDVDPFATGLVQMAEFHVHADSDLAGRTVAEADHFETLTVAALIRDGDVVIARGTTEIHPEDRILVIGPPAAVEAFARDVSPDPAPGTPEDVVIVGGSAIGEHVARLLEARGHHPRLIERDPDRARDLAESLPGTVVMAHDATDVEYLVGEQVDRADVVIAATDSDEKNLLVCILARNIGASRTVAVVETGAYASLFQTVGIDVAINPREATAEEITRFTQAGPVENLSLVEGRRAEVVELQIDADSVLADRAIRESVRDLPDGVVIGAVTRGDEFIVPRGDTVIHAGDHVVVFAAATALDGVLAAV